MAREGRTAVRINLGHMIVDSPARMAIQRDFRIARGVKLKKPTRPRPYPLSSFTSHTPPSTHGRSSLQAGFQHQGLARLTGQVNVQVLTRAPWSF